MTCICKVDCLDNFGICLLRQIYADVVAGSGNYGGDYWFVGMEEGGGNELDQVSARLNTWIELGETKLVNIYNFHIKISTLNISLTP